MPVESWSRLMLVIPANAALMRMSTPDAFINVPMQSRKLMRVCNVKRWSSAKGRSIGLGMQSDTVGGRL